VTDVGDALRALVREVVREELARERGTASTSAGFVGTREAAKIAGVKPHTIRRWISTGKLRATGVSMRATDSPEFPTVGDGRYRIARADLDAYLRSGGRERDALTPREKARRDFG
jgi:hypothetical protein